MLDIKTGKALSKNLIYIKPVKLLILNSFAAETIINVIIEMEFFLYKFKEFRSRFTSVVALCKLEGEIEFWKSSLDCYG